MCFDIPLIHNPSGLGKPFINLELGNRIKISLNLPNLTAIKEMHLKARDTERDQRTEHKDPKSQPVGNPAFEFCNKTSGSGY